MPNMSTDSQTGPGVIVRRKAAPGFRPAEKQDYQAICDLVSTEEELFLVYAQATWPFTARQVQQLVDIRMRPTVMRYQGAVAGFANFYWYKQGKSVFLGNIVIDESLRGKGLGRQLIDYMLGLAFNKYDLPCVKLHVYNRNLGALLVYNAMGFRPYAMKTKQDFNGDPVIMLSLMLKRENWQGI